MLAVANQAVVQKVDCIRGCGGGGTDALTFALTIGSLLVAAVAAGFAIYAAIQSKRSADAADASLKMSREEHAEFMKGLRARAEFTLSLSLDNSPDNVVETRHDQVKLNWSAGFDNTKGEKVAVGVGVHFLVPDDLENLTWRTQLTDHMWGGAGVMKTSEELPTANGHSYRAVYLEERMERVDRSTSFVCFTSAVVDAPMIGEERIVPVKFKVWSDDLEPNEENGERSRWLRHETVVRRLPDRPND